MAPSAVEEPPQTPLTPSLRYDPGRPRSRRPPIDATHRRGAVEEPPPPCSHARPLRSVDYPSGRRPRSPVDYALGEGENFCRQKRIFPFPQTPIPFQNRGVAHINSQQPPLTPRGEFFLARKNQRTLLTGGSIDASQTHTAMLDLKTDARRRGNRWPHHTTPATRRH